MKNLIVKNSLLLIKNNKPEYSDEKIMEIEYGLVSLYLTISKTIVICTIAALLGIFKELVILTIIYNFIRMPSFGIHASKSWMCWISSLLIFIGGTFLCTLITIPINIKTILGIIGIILIFKNSPADTKKRPIINPKRRLTYKIISTFVAITFALLSLITVDNFLSNCFIFTLILQCFMTSPMTYKLFGLSYDNYKNYIK